ncbi:MAG TPA: hypothetical protein VKZ79_20825 [Alphaproteobacteria bacterium]|nr:hypothetical protein [Alphaproteobacteria bacterium]
MALPMPSLMPALRRWARFLALLLLATQLGSVAHRIEHYILAEQMECGEDGCTAFAPVTDPPVLPPLVLPPRPVVFFVRFWTAREPILVQAAERLGFRAQAPPASLFVL